MIRLIIFIYLVSKGLLASDIQTNIDKNWSSLINNNNDFGLKCVCVFGMKTDCDITERKKNLSLYYNEDFLEGPAVIFKGMPYTIKKIDSELLIAEGVASFSDMTIKIMNKSQTNLYIVDLIHEKKIYFCQDS